MIAAPLAAGQSSRDVVWWIHPAKLLCFFIIPLYGLVFLAPELLGHQALQLLFRFYLDWNYFLLGLLFLIVLTLGAAVGSLIVPRKERAQVPSPPIREGYLEFLALATIGAYALWFKGFILNPALIVGALAGQGLWGGREANATIPGVTTLTQLGIAYVVFYCDRVWRVRDISTARRFHWYFYLIFACAAFRVYAWAERLALVEIAVPVVVLFFMHRYRPSRYSMRTLVALGPFAGVLLLIGYFAATEFFRSWFTHYQYQREDFWTFILTRILSYYYTALNNGAGMLQVLDWPTYKFEHLLRWLYRFPALVGPIYRFTFDVEDFDTPFLRHYADPEFNNPSGIFPVFLDAGIAGALLIAVLWGALIGYFFRGCKTGRGIGRFLYPIGFVSLLEVMRVLYLGDPRAFPAVLCVVVGFVFFMQSAPAARAVPPIRRPARTVLVRRAGLLGRLLRNRRPA